jgi:hypothetical protein
VSQHVHRYNKKRADKRQLLHNTHTKGVTTRTCCRSRNSSSDLVAKYAVISMSKLYDIPGIMKLVARKSVKAH